MKLSVAVPAILISALVLIQSPVFGQASSGGLATSLPKYTKSEMLLAQNEAVSSRLNHPAPASGLSAQTGVCLEKNINGSLLPKIKTMRACAAFPTATVWVEGSRVASFAKPDASKVAKSRVKQQKKTTVF